MVFFATNTPDGFKIKKFNNLSLKKQFSIIENCFFRDKSILVKICA
ncbi:hypothetical protein FORC47_p407 (plasmid) [Bacillus cereus]|nr:hypothetical protein FORC47_p407 [Bacillus cereus]